jgi:hypothetical protein
MNVHALSNPHQCGGASGATRFVTPTEIYVESSLQRQVIKIDQVTFDEISTSDYASPPDAKWMRRPILGSGNNS